MEMRRRRSLGSSDRPCGMCGSSRVTLVESRADRRGLHRLNPRWDPRARTYDLCGDCGAKHAREAGQRL